MRLEEVFVFDSKSENRDRAVEAVESALGLGFRGGYVPTTVTRLVRCDKRV